MAALCNRAGHIFALWFVSSFFPRLISAAGLRLDVYLTSTHGVALVQIQNVGLKCAACGSLKMQDLKLTKNRHLCTIAQLCRAISSQLRSILTIRNKNAKQQYLFQTSPQYSKLRSTNGKDRSAGLGHPSKFQWVLRLGFVTAATSFTRGQPNFAAEG